MEANSVKREVLTDGSVKLSAGSCGFVFCRLRPGTLLVTITGLDSGQFGTSTLDEIRMELLRNRPLELFIDAREAVGVHALRRENGTWIAEIGSGSYEFFVASLDRELVRARPGAQL